MFQVFVQKDRFFFLLFHLSPCERSTSEPSSSIVPLRCLTEEVPKSTHDSVEHVDSGMPRFSYQKSLCLVDTHPSNSNFPSLCQNILASISAFVKKITSPAFLLTLFIQLTPILEKKGKLAQLVQPQTTDQLPQQQIVENLALSQK